MPIKQNVRLGPTASSGDEERVLKNEQNNNKYNKQLKEYTYKAPNPITFPDHDVTNQSGAFLFFGTIVRIISQDFCF